MTGRGGNRHRTRSSRRASRPASPPGCRSAAGCGRRDPEEQNAHRRSRRQRREPLSEQVRHAGDLLTAEDHLAFADALNALRSVEVLGIVVDGEGDDGVSGRCDARSSSARLQKLQRRPIVAYRKVLARGTPLEETMASVSVRCPLRSSTISGGTSTGRPAALLPSPLSLSACRRPTHSAPSVDKACRVAASRPRHPRPPTAASPLTHPRIRSSSKSAARRAAGVEAPTGSSWRSCPVRSALASH